MARSKLIHDFVSGINLESIFFRLKVIFSDLDNNEINNWIDNEIEGYKGTKLPSYRIPIGKAIGDYTLVRTDEYNIETSYSYKNEEIPFYFKQDLYTPDLYNIGVSNGVSSLLGVIENKSTISYVLDSETCDSISAWGVFVEKMKIEINEREILDILSSIKSRLLKIILELEKNFEGIDSLDIFGDNVSLEAKEDISQTIINIIFHNHTDNSIEIGDNNKLKSSEIGHRSDKVVD